MDKSTAQLEKEAAKRAARQAKVKAKRAAAKLAKKEAVANESVATSASVSRPQTPRSTPESLTTVDTSPPTKKSKAKRKPVARTDFLSIWTVNRPDSFLLADYSRILVDARTGSRTMLTSVHLAPVPPEARANKAARSKHGAKDFRIQLAKGKEPEKDSLGEFKNDRPIVVRLPGPDSQPVKLLPPLLRSRIQSETPPVRDTHAESKSAPPAVHAVVAAELERKASTPASAVPDLIPDEPLPIHRRESSAPPSSYPADCPLPPPTAAPPMLHAHSDGHPPIPFPLVSQLNSLKLEHSQMPFIPPQHVHDRALSLSQQSEITSPRTPTEFYTPSRAGSSRVEIRAPGSGSISSMAGPSGERMKRVDSANMPGAAYPVEITSNYISPEYYTQQQSQPMYVPMGQPQQYYPPQPVYAPTPVPYYGPSPYDYYPPYPVSHVYHPYPNYVQGYPGPNYGPPEPQYYYQHPPQEAYSVPAMQYPVPNIPHPDPAILSATRQ